MTYVLHPLDSIDMLLKTVIKSNRREGRCGSAHPNSSPNAAGARGHIGFSMLGNEATARTGFSPEYPFEGWPTCGM